MSNPQIFENSTIWSNKFKKSKAQSIKICNTYYVF